MARPPLLADESVVSICTTEATNRLHADSDRLAVLNKIIAAGGKMSIQELNVEFGFNTRSIVNHLVASGWLKVLS